MVMLLTVFLDKVKTIILNVELNALLLRDEMK
jgi:hypothetical protein